MDLCERGLPLTESCKFLYYLLTILLFHDLLMWIRARRLYSPEYSAVTCSTIHKLCKEALKHQNMCDSRLTGSSALEISNLLP